MKLVWSDKFKDKIRDYFDYCLINYGKALTSKKQSKLKSMLDGILMFPQSGRIEQLLKGMDKEYRALNFEKFYRIIYTVKQDEITLVTLWNTKMSPRKLKKDL